MQQSMDQKHNIWDMQLQNLKNEQGMRHEQELRFVKDNLR